MRVGIDCRFAGTHSGLGRYTRELTHALLERQDGIEYVLFVRNKKEDWLRSLPSSTHYSPDFAKATPGRLLTTHSSHYSLSEQFLFPRLLKQSKIDLLFSPHFNVPLLCPVPFIVTIHDLILHRYPNRASLFRRAAYRLLLWSTLRRAKNIIAVSKFTAAELISVYGKKLQQKTTVISEGVSPVFSPRPLLEQKTVREKYSLGRPYFLYVGNAKEHKNVQTLIDAFLACEFHDRDLILVTGGKEAKRLTIGRGVKFLQPVSEEDLPALYSGAIAFVTASLYEGFGLPVIEAHACDCPVIVSNCGALPEIAPPGSMILPPTVAAFKKGFLTPPSKPDQISVPSWRRTAEETVNVLRTAIEN